MSKLDIYDMDFDADELAKYQVPKNGGSASVPSAATIDDSQSAADGSEEESVIEVKKVTESPSKREVKPLPKAVTPQKVSVIQQEDKHESITDSKAGGVPQDLIAVKPIVKTPPKPLEKPQDVVKTQNANSAYVQTKEPVGELYKPSVPRGDDWIPADEKKSYAKVIATGVSVFAILGASAFGAYSYVNLKNENNQLADTQVAVIEQAKELERNVEELIVLEDEEPEIRSVVDAEKIKTQSFFVNAQNGDKVLIYSKNNKVILYRPSSNKIVEVAPIGRNTETGQTAGASTENSEQ